jgi:hypothetical protein
LSRSCHHGGRGSQPSPSRGLAVESRTVSPWGLPSVFGPESGARNPPGHRMDQCSRSSRRVIERATPHGRKGDGGR